MTHPSTEGLHRENMSLDQARQYLDQYPNGTLHHDWFERETFITLDANGRYVFYSPHDEQVDDPSAAILIWDWVIDVARIKSVLEEQDPDITRDWWYCPGREMNLCVGGAAWWEAVRNGDYT